MTKFKVGQGFDLHRLVADRRLILGGVEIPFSKGLLGHSDADVLIHAIVDALLGAAGLGDIGQHFSDVSAEYKDIDSRELLRITRQKISDSKYLINNIDATIIIEQPKLAPYIDQMRDNIACDLLIKHDQVNIKAKTSEGIGIVGESKAAIAQAVVLLNC